jgi:hypothetical protein
MPPASGHRLEHANEAEVSSARTRLLDDVPTVWLDQLLVATLDLPVASGEGAIVDAMLDSLATILPTYAVGACVVRDLEHGGAIVARRVPAGVPERVAGSDPARVFPWLEHEYVIPIPGPDGSTLHLGARDADLDPEGPPAARLLERAAMVLGRVPPRASATRRPSTSEWRAPTSSRPSARSRRASCTS